MTLSRNARDRARYMNRELEQMRRTIAELPRLVNIAVVAVDMTLDGWPAKSGDGGPGSGVSDPVGRMVGGIDGVLEVDAKLRMAWLLMTESVATVHAHLNTIIAATARTAPESPESHANCRVGVTLPGVDEWGTDATTGLVDRCDDLVHADGLCAKHWSARQRWINAKRAGRTYKRRVAVGGG